MSLNKKKFHRLRLLLTRLTRHICDVCQRRSVRCPSLGHISKTKQDRPISFHGMLSGSDGVSCFSIQLLSVTALVQYRYIARSWRPAPQPAGSELGECTSPPPTKYLTPPTKADIARHFSRHLVRRCRRHTTLCYYAIVYRLHALKVSTLGLLLCYEGTSHFWLHVIWVGSRHGVHILKTQ